MSIFSWSQTADNNQTADSSINLREGQAPSTLNDAVRAVMAALAKWRDDLSASLVTAGTNTAYTLATNSVFDSLAHMDKQQIAFQVHTNNGGACTLAVDGLTPKPLHSKPGTDFAANQLLLGVPYTATYFNSAGEFIVEGGVGNLLASFPSLSAMETQGENATNGVLRKTAANTFTLDEGDTAITFEKDNTGNVLATGIMGDAQVPFACTIIGVTVLADQAGSAVIDIWKQAYASYPPVVANSIVASAAPTLSSANKYTDTTLSGWTTAIAAGDCLRFNLNSVTSITRLTIILKVKRFT